MELVSSLGVANLQKVSDMQKKVGIGKLIPTEPNKLSDYLKGTSL